jgi:beta-phosphoglucomutase
LAVPSATDVIETWLLGERPAVVFDFNGTLSDDEHILFDIFSELFGAHLGWAMTAKDYRDELLGRSDREIIERAVARHGRGTQDEVTELMRLRHGLYKRRVAAHNPIGSTAEQLVKLLADNQIPVGIVTGAQREDVLAVLHDSPTGELVSVLIAEEDVSNPKPHPEGFLAAARMLDRQPNDVLVFEDSVPGVQARTGRRHALHRGRRSRARPGPEGRGPCDRGRVIGRTRCRSAQPLASRTGEPESTRDLIRIRARSERW